MLVHKQLITADTGGANVDYTTVPFQPKAQIFWGTKLTAGGFGVNRSLSFGFSDGVNHRAIGLLGNDGATVSNGYTGRKQDNAVCIRHVASYSGGLVTDGVSALLNNFLSNGYTLNYIDPGVAALIHGLSLGGADITNALVTTISAPLVTGVTPYVIGFQPDFAIFIHANATATVPGSFGGGQFSIGMASSPTERGCCYNRETSIPTSLFAGQFSDRVILGVNGSGSPDLQADLASWNADGLSLNFSVVSVDAVPIFCLFLKTGGAAKVFTETQRTSVGTKAKTGLPFQPVGLFSMGTNRAASASIDATDARLSLGASDGTNHGCIWGGSTDNVSTTDENSCTRSDRVIVHAANPNTVLAEASIQSFTSDGYVKDWAIADAIARESIEAAFGPTPPPPPSSAGRDMLLLGVG